MLPDGTFWLSAFVPHIYAQLQMCAYTDVQSAITQPHTHLADH